MKEPAPQHARPLWAAALLTGLIVPIGYFLLALVAEIFSAEPSSAEMRARLFGFVLFFGLPVSLAAMLLLGLPAVLILRKFEMLTAGTVCIAAALIGGGSLTAVYGFVGASGPFASFWGCLVGFMAGIVFCAIAGVRWRRPDA